MAIKILITGGTFDKEYDELNGQLFFKHTHVNEILKLGRCNLSIQTRTLMMIDSP
jgi:L-asparaginase